MKTAQPISNPSDIITLETAEQLKFDDPELEQRLADNEAAFQKADQRLAQITRNNPKFNADGSLLNESLSLGSDAIDPKIEQNRADAEVAIQQANKAIAQITRITPDESKPDTKDQKFKPYGYADKYPIAAEFTANPVMITQQEPHSMLDNIDLEATLYLVLIIVIPILGFIAIRRISLSNLLVTKIQRANFLLLVVSTIPAIYILKDNEYLFDEIEMDETIVIAWSLSLLTTVFYKPLTKLYRWIISGS